MPRKKKNETASVPETLAEVVTKAASVNVTDTPATADIKGVKKPASKKTTTTTKTTKVKASTNTTAKSAAAPKETIKIQFGFDEFDYNEIKKAVDAAIKAKFKGKIKTVEIYIKPEDRAVYYVINSKIFDQINF